MKYERSYLELAKLAVEREGYFNGSTAQPFEESSREE